LYIFASDIAVRKIPTVKSEFSGLILPVMPGKMEQLMIQRKFV